MKIVLKRKKKCGKARTCIWEITDQGGRKRQLSTPNIFAGYSVWGNQWLKLLLFREYWTGRINLLVSLFDLFQSGARRRNMIFDRGFRTCIDEEGERYLQVINQRLKQKYPAYEDYPKSTPNDSNIKFDGFIMIDSGGFSLRSPEDFTKVKGLKELYDSNGHKAVQRFILEKQLQTKAEFIITFDRALVPMSIPLEKKQNRQKFSLDCARTALEFKAEKLDAGQGIDALLFAAVHGYGPSPNEIKNEVSASFAHRMYYDSTKDYMEELLSFEKDLGVTFDGFSVGSLVPFANNGLIENIAEAVYDTLKEHNALNRPVHGLGATSEWKIRLLASYGFDLFDTNFHVRMGRNRLYFDPETRKYVKIHNFQKLPCSCVVCTKHTKEHLAETRKGVCEVSTVLLSLHNFYSSFQELTERMSKSIEEGTFRI